MKLYSFITLICYLLVINLVASEASKSDVAKKSYVTSKPNDVIKPNESNKIVAVEEPPKNPVKLVPGPVSCENTKEKILVKNMT